MNPRKNARRSLPSLARPLAYVGVSHLLAAALFAQVPDAPAPAAPSGPPSAAPSAPSAPASGGAGKSSGGGFLGKDVPAFDPGSETMTWDGKSWNVNNNRIFQARFEKYLNAPEATTESDRAYQAIISQILSLLSPQNVSGQNLDSAFRLLPRGSGFDIDARLCDALSDAVYSAWKSQRAQDRLASATQSLSKERDQVYWDAEHIDKGNSFKDSSGGGGGGGGKKGKGGGGTGAQGTPSHDTFILNMEETQHTRRIAEVEAQMKANQLKGELSEIQTKVEFQALIVQFFLQRRFQHVLMATRFYRAVFSDGDTKLNVGKDTKDLFEKSAGMPPTVGTLDSMANEAIRDVREGVQAFEFLLKNNELESGTKRLAEAFTIGEYMPEIRTLAREKKRQALTFSQKANQLISAIEVKDYTLAEKLVQELAVTAKDFDSSKPMAAVETSKTVAQMHLAKARNAAVSGDRTTLETELAAATELWPRNPQLAEISKMIFNLGDTSAVSIGDFDRLLAQKNYRAIYDDNARFIAATALYPDRQNQLKQVMQNMQTIEGAILRADEMARQGNFPGAWESVEKIASQFPEDNKLSQTRANLTTQAADFVRTVRSAQDLEKREQLGSSLAWFLKAQRLYPASDFASDGVSRLVKKILPAT